MTAPDFPDAACGPLVYHYTSLIFDRLWLTHFCRHALQNCRSLEAMPIAPTLERLNERLHAG